MSLYKKNEVIIGNDNKLFIVSEYKNEIDLQCASCVFSKRYNTNYDNIDSCVMRRKYYIKKINSCAMLLPYDCTFKELKGGI